MTQKVVLHITEHGDASVGIFDQQFDIEFPYEVDITDEYDLAQLKHFEQSMRSIYDLFCENRTTSDWDFVLKQEALNEAKTK